MLWEKNLKEAALKMSNYFIKKIEKSLKTLKNAFFLIIFEKKIPFWVEAAKLKGNCFAKFQK